MNSSHDPRSTLHRAGYRATTGRVTLLNLLAQEAKPLTVAELHKKIGVQSMNEVTLYRALESLASSGIVARVDLRQDRAARYELRGKHHHHIVCTACGAVEDFSDTVCDSLTKKVAQRSSSFKTISDHSMELFGLCRNCF